MLTIHPSLPYTILTAAVATGAGAAFAMPRKRGSEALYDTLTWQVNVVGSFSDLTIVLEGSNDGVNWYTVDTSTSTSGDLRYVQSIPVTFMRANCTTFTGGTYLSVIVQLGD